MTKIRPLLYIFRIPNVSEFVQTNVRERCYFKVNSILQNLVKAQFVFLILCAQVRNSVISFYSRAFSFSSTVTGKHTEDAAVGRGGENHCYGHKKEAQYV